MASAGIVTIQRGFRPAPRSPAANRAIGAFVFDVDGVIADTADHHLAAWRRIAEGEGLAFDANIARDLRGLSREQSLRRILGERSVDAARFDELMRRKNEYYVAAMESISGQDILPGVCRLLDDLGAAGVRVAAASASRNARRALEKLGVTNRFEAIVDGADESKSASGLHRFLLAAAALRVAPQRCVVVEDSLAGVAAARSFGMRVVGIGDWDVLCAATLVFESLRGVRGRALIEWLSEGDAAERCGQRRTVSELAGLASRS